VPYSKRSFWYPDFDNLRDVSVAFQDVEIINENYTIARKANSGDIVYLDPPYLPVSKTSNFVSYTKDGFGLKEQEDLGIFFEELSSKGVFVALSNSDHSEIHRIYSKIPNIKIEIINVRRAINSDPTKRSPVNELLITNYFGN
jgi:DNA adenine methylase